MFYLVKLLVPLALATNAWCLSESDENASEVEDRRYKCIGRDLVDPYDIQYLDEELRHVGIIVSNIFRATEEGEVPKMITLLTEQFNSIIENSGKTPLHLIIITDPDSQKHVEKALVNEIGHELSTSVLLDYFERGESGVSQLPPRVCIEFVNLTKIVEPHRNKIDEMKYYYCQLGQKDKIQYNEDGHKMVMFTEKYCQDLFFLSPFYHHAFPPGLKKLILLDVDLEFYADIDELWQQFDNMEDEQLIGVALDQHCYYCKLEQRKAMYPPWINIRPDLETGLNTGVVLFDLEKLRKSQWFKFYTRYGRFEDIAFKYQAEGNVGDQDWLTLLLYDVPHLFYRLPCQFNVQMEQLYKVTRCLEEPKIMHKLGNIH